jgi:regulator of protease activity HflC (stomatin/prohibitin superfamily)
MADLIRVLIEVLHFLSPLRAVHQWQHGVYYVMGKAKWVVGPGCWPIIPYFMDVRPVDMVPAVYGTPLQTITLRDNRALTFSASITVKVEDANKALNSLDNWPETTVETVSGLLSEKLADVEPTRFDPARGKRDRLLEELRNDATTVMEQYGVKIMTIRFNNFVLGIRTYRLLTETATMTSSQKTTKI